MYGPSVGGGGLGRYVEQLVTELQKQDQENRYVLFLKKENFEACEITNPRFEKRLADVHWYTLREQIFLPKLIDREHLDLIHFPHWNVPLFCKTPFVVTIHDLILLEEPMSAKATTRHPAVFALKRIGYRIVLHHAMQASKKIIAVSQYTKSAIQKFFPFIPSEKISVVYEGVTKLPEVGQIKPSTSVGRSGHNLFSERAERVEGSDRPYLLYVGNAYPHKNLEFLIQVFQQFSETHPEFELMLAGRDDLFYKRLRGIAKEKIRFVMNPSDNDLAELYRNATAYVFPSRSEGFGLPPLEAMSVGVPVAASRIGALTEILGDAAVSFSPDSPDELIQVMEKLSMDTNLRVELIKKGFERVKQYSWATMAQQIRQTYELVTHSKTE